MNEEGELCGNPECTRPMKKDKGHYVVGHHVVACSDGCEASLWRQHRHRRQMELERYDSLEEVIKNLDR